MMPKNTREKVIYRLDKTHDWEKVAGLNMADTNEERFIPLLHNIDAEKMERFVKKMGKEEKQREEQKLDEISTGEARLVNPVVAEQKHAPWILKQLEGEERET